MRAAVVLVLALLALGAVSVSEARRIHRMRAALRADDEAVEAIDVDAEATLPFDDDYWTAGGQAEFSKTLAKAAKGKAQNTADIVKKFFSDDNIKLAQQQSAPVKAVIGTFKAVAMTRSCNQGVCDDNWTPFALSTNTQNGADGQVALTCDVKDLTKAKCDVNLWINGGNNALSACYDIGATKSCSRPQYIYKNSLGTWSTNYWVSDVLDGMDLYFNADQLVINWKYHGTSNGKLVFSAIGLYVTPFNGYKQTVNPAAPAPLAPLTAAMKKPLVTTADILKKFFSQDNIQLAQWQSAPVVADIGTFAASAVTRTCNNGVCTEWTPFPLATDTQAGSTGTVRLTCDVKDVTKAKCDINFWINSGNNAFTACYDIGAATAAPAKSCSRPQYIYKNSLGTWSTNYWVSDVLENFGAYFVADSLAINWRYHGTSNGKLVGTDITIYVQSFGGYKQTVNPDAPAPLPALVAAQKAGVLNTQQLLAKFFTKDNIALAQMQGSSVPVKATISAFKASANTRTCNNGVCAAWSPFELNSDAQAGGEGSVVMTCSVPANLAQAKCDVSFWINGGSNALTTCYDIGGAGAKSCSRPQYIYKNSLGTWSTNYWVSDVLEVNQVLFTNDALVLFWKYHGTANSKLVGTELTVQTTMPFADFSVPPKTNCLSKTTVKDVMDAAASKLKNKVTLTATAVDALIKSAPYKTVEEAIVKIKGIGPVNVVYVSFMWNFQC